MGDDCCIDAEDWSPSNISYPTWEDVCRFVVSRPKTGVADLMNKGDAIRQMAKFVNDIWTAGDGSPKSVKKHCQTILRESQAYFCKV